MSIPLRIAARGLVLSEIARSSIEFQVKGLEPLCPRIASCVVHIDGPDGHRGRGSFQVRLLLSVPGRDVVISRNRSATFQEALGDAFRAAGRRLEAHTSRRRGEVKAQSPGADLR